MTNSPNPTPPADSQPPLGIDFWERVLESHEYGVLHLGSELPRSFDRLVRVETSDQLREIFAANPAPPLSSYVRDHIFIDTGLDIDRSGLEHIEAVPGQDQIELAAIIDGRDAFEVHQEIFDGFREHVCGTRNIGPYDDARGEPRSGHPVWLEHGVHFVSHSHWSGYAEWNSHSHWVSVGNDPVKTYPDPPDGLDHEPDTPASAPLRTIGVIDTGVDKGPLNGKSHPWFPDAVVDGDAEKSRNISDWPSGHGTIVTGVLRKCAPASGIIVKRVDFDHHISMAHEFDVIEAIWSMPEECRLLNLSFGGRFFGCNGPLYRVLHRWVREGQAQDQRRVISAAGNREDPSHHAFVSRPAAFDCVRAVAAGPSTTFADDPLANVGGDPYRTAKVTDPDSYHAWSNGSWGAGVPDWVDFIVKVRHNSLQNPADTQRRIFSTAPLDANGDPRYSASYGTSVVAPLVTAEFDRGNSDPTVTNGHIRGHV